MSDLLSDLSGPDQPPRPVNDDYHWWAVTVIRRAVPDYIWQEKSMRGFALDRLTIEIAAALREFYQMGQHGTPIGLWEETARHE